MINIEITLKNVSAKDYKVIMFLHKITEDSLYEVQWRISQGLPVFSNTVSYYDCYDKDAVIARLIDYFQKKQYRCNY
jgi:hypothetical protein